MERGRTSQHVAERIDCLTKLPVAEVRSWAQTKDLAAEVIQDPAEPELA